MSWADELFKGIGQGAQNAIGELVGIGSEQLPETVHEPQNHQPVDANLGTAPTPSQAAASNGNNSQGLLMMAGVGVVAFLAIRGL